MNTLEQIDRNISRIEEKQKIIDALIEAVDIRQKLESIKKELEILTEGKLETIVLGNAK